MLGPEDADRVAASGGRKNYLRSVSWTDRSPSKPNPRPPSTNNKARLCLPPLQPLSVSRRNMEEWPNAGSDDLGVWPSVQTPRGAIGELMKDSENPKPREFQFKRDKLAFFDKECSKIAEHIYLGSDAVAKNREVLRQNGITHVLNCVGFVSPEYFKSDLVYKTLWLQDSPSEDITSILYDVFDYFEDVREQGGRVLVHCCQGVSRSTSLVIAYLMWREGQSFEDAFQYVKAARGVTNPNMGFACQLLQHQKRGNVVPASPGPVLRMYRMAPHSPYDPLHLVPKLLNEPSVEGLDSRGAFIVHVPSAIYVWIGKGCKPVMLNKAMASAFQVIRYERAQGPILRIKEGEEPSGFWDALVEESVEAKREATCWVVGSRRVEKYDLDFEIFHKALAGGIVPPSAQSMMESETCLPTRENGWDRLRQKFASGEIKEFVTSAKLKGVNLDTHGGIGTELDDDTTSTPSTPSSITYPCGSPDSFSCFLNSSSPKRIKDPNFVKEDHQNASFCNSPDSFSCIPIGSPIFSSKSPTLSPSSDYSSSSFTFSPSSSNWSDFPYLSSQQPSPSSGLEPNQTHVVIKDVLSKQDNSCLSHHKESFASNNVVSELAASPLSWKGMVPSLAERRGSNPPTRVLLPSVDEHSHGRKNLVRSCSFSLDDLDDEVMNDVDCDQSDSEGDVESLTLATEHSLTSKSADEMQIDNVHPKNCDFTTCSCTDGLI